MPQSKRSGGRPRGVDLQPVQRGAVGLPEPRQPVEAVAGRLGQASQRRDRGVRGDAAEAVGVLRAQAQRAEPAHRQPGDRQRRGRDDAIVGQRGGGGDLLDDPAFVVGVGVRDVAAAKPHRPSDGIASATGAISSASISRPAVRCAPPFSGHDQALPRP